MGLFDFLKKPQTDSSEVANKSDPSESGERTSVFKGDLAFISETNTENEAEPVRTDPVNVSSTTDDKDSTDSIIFLSFTPMEKGCWVCSECGTRNEEGLTGCIVCGLKR